MKEESKQTHSGDSELVVEGRTAENMSKVKYISFCQLE